MAGVKRSEETRRRTGLASRGRKKSPAEIERLRKAFTGPNNPLWNPDREQLERVRRVRKATRALLGGALSRLGARKTARTEEMLGYTAEQLATHLEALFLPGMSWKSRSEWHIDHIKPLSRFVKEGVTDLKVINALSNLQPLWKSDNLKKNARYSPMEQTQCAA